MRHPLFWMVSCALTFALVGCSTDDSAEPKEPTTQTPTTNDQQDDSVTEPKDEPTEPSTDEEPVPSTEGPAPAPEIDSDEPVEVPEQPTEEATEPEVAPTPEPEPAQPKQAIETNGQANLKLDTLVLVNKQIALPKDYQPSDLVTPNIPFVASATGERRTLRQPAARAIESLIADAKAAGIELKGTSAFRSYAYQVQLFNAYVARDGKEQALKYSAPPGHSEHQTGLAIDVSSASVNYELTQALGQQKEGEWLANHAHEHGFIIRYQKAYEKETGYMYEPWHLRYIGIEHATAVYEQNVPLDRYLEEIMK